MKSKVEGTGIEALVGARLRRAGAPTAASSRWRTCSSKDAEIDAVFCENDSMCLGAQKAIADAGRSGDIFITSVDGEKGALDEIMKEGSNYAATGLNTSDQIGRAGFHRAMAILAGAVPEKETVLPSPIITIDNVVKFYNPDSTF